MKKEIVIKPIFGAHQIYQEIVNNPPLGIKYLGVSGETKEGNYYQNKKRNEFVNRVSQFFKLPRMRFFKSGNFNIIHSSRGIIPLTRKPWVMDVEYFTSFMGLHFDIMVKNKFVRWLVKNRLASKNCKKILCHCEATRQSFFKYLECEKFKHKLEVLYPSSHLVDFKVEKSNKIRFLFVSSLFKHKGGDFVLEAFRKIHEKYPKTELLIRADVPAETRKRYGDEGIIFEDYSGKNILPREEFIKNVFSRGDVFIYTTFCDSLGYSLFDALISKMPIIGTNLFAVPEIVLDGKNGFVLDIPGYNREKWVQEHHIDKMTSEDKKKFVNLLTKSMENFIKNPSLIKKMGREGYRRISNGDLSISERNKKLKEVYLGALK